MEFRLEKVKLRLSGGGMCKKKIRDCFYLFIYLLQDFAVRKHHAC